MLGFTVFSWDSLGALIFKVILLSQRSSNKFNVVLKGVSSNFSVKNGILTKDPNLKVSVKYFESKWSKEKNFPLGLFLCTLEDRADLIKLNPQAQSQMGICSGCLHDSMQQISAIRACFSLSYQ